MDIGIAIFPTDRGMDPAELGREVEARGFGALMLPEHTHMPVDHSPWPGGADLPDEYRRTLDPFVALGAVAAVTEHIRLGTGICLVAQRDPIVLAKEVATLDRISGGRVDLGIGFGWNRPELEHHGVRWQDRRDVVRERVQAMKALWTEERAAFDGEHVRFADSWAWPKPVQEPHPQILLGAGLGSKALADLIGWCDGWLPIGASGLREAIPRLQAAAAEAGRDPLPVTVYGTTPEPGRLHYLAGLGVERTYLWLPPDGRGEIMAALDRFAALRDEVTDAA